MAGEYVRPSQRDKKRSMLRTFGENFPLARFAAGGIGKNAVQFVKQILHLAPTFTFCHLMADAQFWSPAVVAGAR